MTHITDLPNELLCEIIKYLTLSKDICALSRANHRLYVIATEQLNSNLHHLFKSKNKTYGEHQAFRRAVKDGKDLCVRKFLKAGLEIMHHGSEEHPILLAARQGHAKIVQDFLEYGIDPNPLTEFLGWMGRKMFGNPLTVAAEHGRVSVVRLLIEHGVQLEFDREEVDDQPLSLATKGRHIEVVKVLLDHGCDPHTPGRRRTAWRTAAESDLNILKLFIDRGAEPVFFAPSGSAGLKNEYHWAMMTALRQVDIPLMKFLFEQGVELERWQPFNWYTHALDHIGDCDPLYRIGSAIGRSPQNAEFLSEKIDLDGIVNGDNLRDLVSLMTDPQNAQQSILWSGKTILAVAWQLPYEEVISIVVELLIDYGADPRGAVKDRLARDGYRPPIFTAARYGHTEIIELLLDRGANPFPRQPVTLFEIATDYYPRSLPDIVRVLLKRDILTPKTARKGKARNTLKVAVNGGAEVFQLVIQHMGIKLQRGDSLHEEAFEEAVGWHDTTILKYFIEAVFYPILEE
ncbi:ankyrin [Penicillium malachiteum]|uniref:ankyrin n=1 Tax=Penicillium malachiteum TaxID=1324776 RepID=UPI002546BFBA|nr:ankyrin [Penicillium malachiteum]KAJ5713672.1 ankyrin [Penicillium malachiteum]